MGIRIAFAAAAAVAVFAVQPATAAKPKPKTLRINWTESYAVPDATGWLVFHITNIVVASTKWEVTASVTNRSDVPIAIEKGYPWQREAGFGIGIPHPTNVHSGDLAGISVLLRAYAKPRLPSTLQPSQSWSGTFGGYAVLPKRKRLYLTFGKFVQANNPNAREFVWITDHTFSIP